MSKAGKQRFSEFYKKLVEASLLTAYIKELDKLYSPARVSRDTVVGWSLRNNVPIQYRIAVVQALNIFKYFINKDKEIGLFEIFPNTEHIYQMPFSEQKPE